METSVDYHQLTSPCGLDCFNCPAYLANTDMELRAGIAETLNIPMAAAKCEGCRNENGVIAFLGDDQPCDVFRCTRDQGVAYCFECRAFPCDQLHPYADKATARPHNTKVFNLCLIKKLGVDSWAKEKALTVRQTYFTGTLCVHAADKKKSDDRL